MKRALILLIVILLLAAGYLASCYLGGHPPLTNLLAPGQPGATADATGIIEATRVIVSAQLAGRISALYVAEGDQVAEGQLLLTLDDTLIRRQIAQAEAAIAEAEARLALLKAGARPEQIEHARAMVAQAEVGLDVARQAWEDARLLRDNPQDLDLQIIEAETKAVKAQHEAQAAHLLAEAADLQMEMWGRVTQMLAQGFDVPLPGGGVYHVDRPIEREQANTQWNLASQQAWQAWQAAYAAEDAAKAAQVALDDLRRQRANPIALDTRVNQAEAAYHQAEAALEQAQAALRVLEEGATAEQIEVARKAVEEARAGRAALEVQLDHTRIYAPRAGLVSLLTVHAGEVALPGTPLLEITDLSQVQLTVYVPEPQLGHIWLGQTAHVTVDSFPGRIFTGTVTHIADRAEFTPKNVQTREERVNTVFAVEITLPNPEAVLKPGMPADAAFLPEGKP